MGQMLMYSILILPAVCKHEEKMKVLHIGKADPQLLGGTLKKKPQQFSLFSYSSYREAQDKQDRQCKSNSLVNTRHSAS